MSAALDRLFGNPRFYPDGPPEWLFKSRPPRSWWRQHPWTWEAEDYLTLVLDRPNVRDLVPESWLNDPIDALARAYPQLCGKEEGRRCWDNFRAACRGEIDGMDLMDHGHELNTLIAAALFQAKAPTTVLRSAIRYCQLNSYSVLAKQLAARPREFLPDRFMAAFRACEFPTPAEWGDTITVYHGDNDATRDDYFSWTTSRAAACWWATRINDEAFNKQPPTNPRVLRRVVPVSSVVFYEPPGPYTHPHDEIGFDLPREDIVDGHPDEWARWARAFSRKAQRTPCYGGTEPYGEPELPAPKPAGSLAERYADRNEWPALQAELLQEIKREMSANDARDLAQAMAGKASLSAFVGMLDLYQVGPVVLTLYFSNLSADQLRPLVQDGWVNAHWSMREATAPYGPSCLPDLFRACEFSIPAEWGETITVYHGDRGLSVEEARKDIAWTADYPTACFWALKYLPGEGIEGTPVVLSRQVPRSAILAHITAYGEDEVVIDAPPAGELHGGIDDWQQGCADFAEREAKRLYGDDAVTSSGRRRRAAQSKRFLIDATTAPGWFQREAKQALSRGYA